MITLRQGDLLSSDCNVICHQVNCQGVMGAGFAKVIREAYPHVYNVYRCTCAAGENKLGNIDVAMLRHDHNARFIINMYAQYDYRPRGVCHTDYDAFRKCCATLKLEITSYQQETKRRQDPGRIQHFKIGFPYKIGCGLAGGKWEMVESILRDEFGGDEWNVEIWKL